MSITPREDFADLLAKRLGQPAALHGLAPTRLMGKPDPDGAAAAEQAALSPVPTRAALGLFDRVLDRLKKGWAKSPTGPKP
jgi:hypothetical protein